MAHASLAALAQPRSNAPTLQLADFERASTCCCRASLAALAGALAALASRPALCRTALACRSALVQASLLGHAVRRRQDIVPR